MAQLLEYVGNVHIFLGPYRGNPIALYLLRGNAGCEIAPKIYPWNEVIGKGETPNKAAADFEEKWKARGLTPDMYTGPAWEGGIKPEKPAAPKPAATPKPAPAAAGPTTAATPTPTKPAATTPATDIRAGAPAGTGTAAQPSPAPSPTPVNASAASVSPDPPPDVVVTPESKPLDAPGT